MRERQGRCDLLCRQCAVLRAEVVRRKDEAERERCQAREAAALLRQLELRMEGLATHTDMTLGTKEQAFEQVRSAGPSDPHRTSGKQMTQEGRTVTDSGESVRL